MKIEVGMKCKQNKAIEKFAFDFVGMEFEIIKVNDNVIMGKGDNVCFGIDINEFENYFELVKEEINGEFKVGDTVKVTSKYEGISAGAGGCYSTYPTFFKENNFLEFESRYIWGESIKNGIYKVVGIGKNRCDNDIIYVLENEKQIYLLSNQYNEMKIKKIKNDKALDIKDIKIGQKYRVIENRNTCYGSCVDIVEIEGEEVEVCGVNETNEGDIDIKSKDGAKHTCEVENLELIREEDRIEQVIEQVKQKPSNKVYTYEMIPHKINWKITHNGEIINQVIDSGSESYKLITNGNTIIIILDDGCKGVAKCLPDDEYDLDKGVDIAYTKAMIKSYQKKLKGLVK